MKVAEEIVRRMDVELLAEVRVQDVINVYRSPRSLKDTRHVRRFRLLFFSLSFVFIFLSFSLFESSINLFVLFLSLKLMGYFVEGRRTGSSRTGSRPSHRHYEQIKNVNDVIDLDMTTNTGETTKKDPNLL